MKAVSKTKGDTWPRILQYNYEKYGDSRIAMRNKYNGIWRPYTWEDYYSNVKLLALGLLSLGFKPGDKSLIIGDNAPQWYYAELAIQADHGICVGLYSDLNATEIKYIAQNSEARFAIVEDQEQVDKLLLIQDELSALERVIYWEYKGLTSYDDSILSGYKEVLQLGQEYEKGHPGTFEQNVKKSDTDDVCSLVYTSGTTGTHPKGVLHTYKTMMASATCCLNLDPWSEEDNIVPSLPPAWITEQWIGIGCHLLSGAILNFVEKPDTQQQDTREIGPNIVVYGARLWENQAREVQARLLESNAMNRKAFNLLMPIGYRIAESRHRRTKAGLLWRALYALANVVLFKPLKDKLGLSNARICYNTGAILSPEAFKFYHALNLPLKNLYGTTEGGVLSSSKNDDIRLDTVGRIKEDAEVRITDKGEITYKHPGVSIGYYNDLNKSNEVLKDGWFSSGDGGFVTEDGHLVLLDRVSDLVELSKGDKLAPQFIESRLRFSPFIKDAWVVSGVDKPYASAVIVIDYNSVGRWAGQKKLVYHSFAELSQNPEVYKLVKGYIDRINQDLAPHTRIKKYLNLHKEFDPEEGELTRTRKLRRVILKERYREIINAIYNNKNELQLEIEAKHRNKEVVTTKISIKSVEGAD